MTTSSIKKFYMPRGIGYNPAPVIGEGGGYTNFKVVENRVACQKKK